MNVNAANESVSVPIVANANDLELNKSREQKKEKPPRFAIVFTCRMLLTICRMPRVRNGIKDGTCDMRYMLSDSHIPYVRYAISFHITT